MIGLKKITKSLGFKMFMVAFLILIMLIPVALVVQVVRERARRAEQVEYEILESWGGELRFAGPVLKVPCIRNEETRYLNESNKEVVEFNEVRFDLWITPVNMDVIGEFSSGEKTRGIFSVPIFSGDLRLQGGFDLTEPLSGLKEGEAAIMEEAELVLVLENQKGIRSLNRAVLGGQSLNFKPGDSGFGLLNGGIHANASVITGVNEYSEYEYPFVLELDIQGGRSVKVLPLAGETSAVFQSDWTAPSYQGNYLPSAQSLDESGFEAVWQISNLSRGIPLFWRGYGHTDGRYSGYFFGVDFLKVLDHYAKNERAAKYTILFIIVPFLTLLLFEIFWKREIHPVQYLFAGIGNVVFYLLLLSLSEHMNFNIAYLLSSGGVTLMMFLFSYSLVKDIKKSWYMGPVMILSYLYLFITLQSEDWALLIGSVGAFCIVGLVMFLTRHVNWYGDENNL